MKWDRRFLDVAHQVAAWSKDRSTKVGAVIVGPDREIRATGYNGFPRGVDDEEERWHERPLKYFATEHAERNALYNALLQPTTVRGCTLYVASTPSVLPLCSDCARGVIQCGIRRVVQWEPSGEAVERWHDNCEAAEKMLRQAGVQYERIGR